MTLYRKLAKHHIATGARQPSRPTLPRVDPDCT